MFIRIRISSISSNYSSNMTSVRAMVILSIIYAFIKNRSSVIKAHRFSRDLLTISIQLIKSRVSKIYTRIINSNRNTLSGIINATQPISSNLRNFQGIYPIGAIL